MKNKININNYEEFALDYIEGNLDEDTKKEFEVFLNQNPQIKDELEGISDTYIEPTEEVFENKVNLKHSQIDGLSQLDYLCIADIEGIITPSEKKELKKLFNDNNELLNDYEQYLKTKLKSENIAYPNNKYELKKSDFENISYLEFLLISKIEGEISKEQEAELTEIIKNHPEISEDLAKYNRTKLKADSNIQYSNKKDLKRTQIVTLRNISAVVASIAALLLIFVGAKTLFKENDTQSAQICKNISDIHFIRNVNEIENQKTNEIIFVQQENNYLYAIENDIIEYTTSYDNYYAIEEQNEYVVAEEEIKTKEINLHLTKLKDHYIRFSSIPKPKEYFYNNNRVLAAQNDKTTGQKILDFVVNLYNISTENDLLMKVDIDKENKCYSLEINDKDYNICLDESKFIKIFVQ